jgi:hypothetical protein
MAYLRYYLRFAWKNTEKPQNISARTPSGLAEICAEHLPNKSLECYLQTNLFGHYSYNKPYWNNKTTIAWIPHPINVDHWQLHQNLHMKRMPIIWPLNDIFHTPSRTSHTTNTRQQNYIKCQHNKCITMFIL